MTNFQKTFTICFVIGLIVGFGSYICYAQFPFAPYFNNTISSYFPTTSYVNTLVPSSILTTSFYVPNSAPLTQTIPSVPYYSTDAPSTISYNTNSFYLPSTASTASITGSYLPFTNFNPTATTSGYYYPSITANPAYSSAATNYYLPSLTSVPFAAAPVTNPLPITNPYRPNVTTYSAAAVILDIEGDYTGDWESTLRNDDGDIKKCEIDQEGIVLEGGIKFKDFLIQGQGLSDFTGTITGNGVFIEVLIDDDCNILLNGEVLIDALGEITIAGSYTATALYNGALLDQGIFELKPD
ncbi:MAG: hypothetical protein ACMUJM_11910 [bacterium]